MTSITKTEAWASLYDCDGLLAVLHRSVHSEESSIGDVEAHEIEGVIKSIRQKISTAMGDLEEWSDSLGAET